MVFYSSIGEVFHVKILVSCACDCCWLYLLIFFLIVSIKCGVYFPTSGIGAPGLVSFGLIEYGDEYKQDD